MRGAGEPQDASGYLVEHYWPGVTPETFADAAERLRHAAEELSSGRVAIRFLHSTLALDDEAAFCVFQATSQAAVEEVYARAGVRFERIVGAVEIGHLAREARRGGGQSRRSQA
jgi:Protein of unknown function (DUF4242)